MSQRKIKDEKAIKELRHLYKKYDNILSPDKVVSEARSIKSPLHKYFNWNDTEAANQYRLEQARRLLRFVVDIIPSNNKPVRIFYSLTKDRKGEETGYRTTVDILSDKSLYKELLKDAKTEMECFIEKYEHIKELKKVFAEMKKLL